MQKPLTMLLAVLLVPVSVACAAAQTQAAMPASASAAPPAPSAQTQARRPQAYAGLEIRFQVSVGPDQVANPSYPVVKTVAPGSPAHEAGMLAGDVITEVNGRDSREPRALWFQPGVRYTLRIRTGDQERETVLVPLPPRAPAAAPNAAGAPAP